MLRHLRTIFLLIGVCLLSNHVQAENPEPGVFDFTDIDFEAGSVELDGQWEFYWGKLLSPSDSFPSEKDFLSFPGVWNSSQTTNGVELDNIGYGTYRAIILFPDDHPDLSIFIKHVYCSYRMYFNGQLVASNGEVGTTDETSNPKWVPKVINLPESDRLEIVLQVSNFEHQKGGVRESFILASEDFLDTRTNIVLAFNLLLAGTLLMAGFFFYGLYFFGQRENSALFFSLFCLTFAYRIVGADDYSLQELFPEMPWLLVIKLEYLSLFIPPIFFALYTHTLFPFKYRINPLYVFSGGSGLLALITIVAPSWVFTSFVEIFSAWLIFGIGMCAFTYIRAYRHHLDGSRYALLSSAIILLIVIYKIFNYYGGILEVEVISFVGYLSFFFFQSLILFFIFTNSLKKAKEDAERASNAKSEFLSMMSHEIRTPMNAVIGLTNYLIEDQPKPQQLETLNTLKFSAQNLLVIINDILDFSKIEADKIELAPEVVNLKALISQLRQTFLPMSKKKGIELTFSIDPDIPDYIICDQTRTSQVLTNLISNGIKFTSEGSVKVILQKEELTDKSVTICFNIKDTGIGIPEDKQSAIFHGFTQASSATTRQYGGTGLGLTITKKLLELQGAELNLKSEEGKGSEFSFVQEFEIASEQESVDDKIPEALEKRESLGHRVLLVEDNEVNTIVAIKFLKKWGLNVTVAKNGQLAIEELNSKDFDVILMDLQMPVMDGYEAVRQLRSMGITTPVIALTASALLDRQKKIYDAGMDDFITKPFDPRELLKKIIHFTQ